ncbi:DUF1697 domain-containing protein [Microbacterium sp. NPDC019599]|uniref:DUF1697 domain-containing protein n=1 Tax=Microbacterium sp. NPDC019599 TaxID=3154690 RepID=UPI0033E02648
MTAWVALLRGVNVGGITIRSAELAGLFRELGFDEVRTVLASGNVAFEADAAIGRRDELKMRIEKALRDRFGYDAWILLVTADELAAAIGGFPFDAEDDARQPWVIFCVDGATRDELAEAAASLDSSVDPVQAGAGVVYWNPVKGTTTDTPFAKLLAKKAFKPRTTNRNLRTLHKIAG